MDIGATSRTAIKRSYSSLESKKLTANSNGKLAESTAFYSADTESPIDEDFPFELDA